jgi:tripartite-type tricarboxylate transporter receptor subunit TctC
MKTLFVRAACAALLMFAAGAQADTYPSKPITLVVPFSAGSGTDQVARVVALVMAKQYKANVIVEDKPGASGFIAAQFVANAVPDGYTVLLTTNTTHAANQFLFKHLPYDPVKGFTPVALLAKGYELMVVSAHSPNTTVQAFIDAARRQPGKLNFGSGSSSSQVAGYQFKQTAKVDIVNVQYKSNPQALTDLISGQTQVIFADTPSTSPLVRGGQLRALAVTAPKRLAMLPDVPTLQESGLAGFDMSYWNAVYLPHGAAPAVTAKLNDMLLHVMQAPEMQHLMVSTGNEVSTSTPEGLAEFQASESKKWAAIIKTAGIQPE